MGELRKKGHNAETPTSDQDSAIKMESFVTSLDRDQNLVTYEGKGVSNEPFEAWTKIERTWAKRG